MLHSSAGIEMRSKLSGSISIGWSRGRDLNPRPADYESAALPLSYLGPDCASHSITALYASSAHKPLAARWKVVGSFLFKLRAQLVHCVDLRFCHALDVDVDRETYVAVPQIA